MNQVYFLLQLFPAPGNPASVHLTTMLWHEQWVPGHHNTSTDYGLRPVFYHKRSGVLDWSDFIILTENSRNSISVSLDNIATPVICILSGFLQHRFGPKRILMLACFPYICGWATAAVAARLKSVILLYVSR